MRLNSDDDNDSHNQENEGYDGDSLAVSIQDFIPNTLVDPVPPLPLFTQFTQCSSHPEWDDINPDVILKRFSNFP